MKTIALAIALALPFSAWGIDMPKGTGTVVAVSTGNAESDKDLNGRLHFCLFENGRHDLLYVGTIYGMWSDGKIELTINGKKVFTGKVPAMTYGGTFLDLGDVISKQPESNIGLEITKIKGLFK